MRRPLLVSVLPAFAIVGSYLLNLRTLTALLLMAEVPFVLWVAFLLVRAARQAPWQAGIRSAAVWSLTTALVVTGIGVVALSSMTHLLSPEAAGLIFVTALAIPSVASTYWLLLYLSRRF